MAPARTQRKIEAPSGNNVLSQTLPRLRMERYGNSAAHAECGVGSTIRPALKSRDPDDACNVSRWSLMGLFYP